MYNLIAVQVSHRLTDLLYTVRCRSLAQSLLIFDDFVELPRRAQLKQQIDIVFVVEKAVELDDVGVVQVHLDLQLPGQLVQDVLFFYYVFGDGFECADKTCGFVSGVKDGRT
jgi:hypothetical protein